MAPRTGSDSRVADRIRMRRTARGWSIRYAADRAGLAASTWSRIERGLSSADNRFVLADIARALDCSTADLTGIPLRSSDRDTEAAHDGIRSIRQALLETDLAEAGETVPRPTAHLAADADLIRALRVRCDYLAITRMLPRLIMELHAAAHGPDRERALGMLVQVMYTTSRTTHYLGYPAEAWIAAERAKAAAETLDDPVLTGFAAFAHTHAAMGCDSYARAHTLAVRAVDHLAARVGADGGLETLGMLQLTAAYAARAVHPAGDGVDWLAEADQIAARTGETDTLDMSFGPTNVRLWQIAIEVDAGDPGRAVHLASDVNLAVVNPNRQATFYADVARALARVKQDERAVRMLVTAESVAPQLVHSSPLVQETARSLLDRARRHAAGPQLRGLCERMGLPV